MAQCLAKVCLMKRGYEETGSRGFLGGTLSIGDILMPVSGRLTLSKVPRKKRFEGHLRLRCAIVEGPLKRAIRSGGMPPR